jgi:O-antigen/teichoic acid export membrane protein
VAFAIKSIGESLRLPAGRVLRLEDKQRDGVFCCPPTAFRDDFVTSLGTSAARGAGVTLVAQAVRFCLQIVSLVVMARLLTPADFGLVAMVTAVIGVAEIIRDFGLSSAAIQAKTLSDAERSNLFWVNVGIGTICATFTLLASPLIVDIYGTPQLHKIILSLGWMFIVSGANTQFRAELSRSLRFKALALTDIAAQAAGIVVAIAAALAGAGYWSIVFQQIVTSLMTCAMNIGQCKWKPGRYQRAVPLGRFFRFGGSLLGMQALGYATNNVDNVAIGSYWGAEPLGLYGRGYQLLIVPLNQLANALTQVVLPVLSRVQSDDATYDRYVHRLQLMCCYLFGTGFAVAAGLSGPLVALMFGPQWTGVAPIFAILAIGGMFRGFAQVSYWMCLSRGLTGLQLRLYLVMRPVMIALILGGLPWGPVGVAAGHSLAFFVDWFVSLLWIGHTSGMATGPLLRIALRSVLVISVPAGTAAYLGAQLLGANVGGLAAGVACSLVYLALLGALRPTELRDARLMANIARTALRRTSATAGRHRRVA